MLVRLIMLSTMSCENTCPTLSIHWRQYSLRNICSPICRRSASSSSGFILHVPVSIILPFSSSMAVGRWNTMKSLWSLVSGSLCMPSGFIYIFASRYISQNLPCRPRGVPL